MIHATRKAWQWHFVLFACCSGMRARISPCWAGVLKLSNGAHFMPKYQYSTPRFPFISPSQVGNLLDHFAGAAREYRKVATQLGQQQAHSQRLLSGFDQALAVLRRTPLHPTLVPLLNASSDSSSTSSSAAAAAAAATTLPPDDTAAITSASADEREPAGAREGSATRRAAEEPDGAKSTAATAAAATSTHVVTLADLVPTDKYGPYVAQCTLSAQRLQQSSAELDALFTRLDAGVARQEQATHSETEAARGGGDTCGSQSDGTVAAVAGDISRTHEEITRCDVEGTLGTLAVAAQSSRSISESNREGAAAAEARAIDPSSSISTSAEGARDPSSHVPVEPFEEGQPFAVELAYLQKQVTTVQALTRLQSALAAKAERDYGDARAAVVRDCTTHIYMHMYCMAGLITHSLPKLSLSLLRALMHAQ